MSAAGPLAGVRVLELGGIGPSPFAGMLLAELGADVVRVDRPGSEPVLPIDETEDLLNRGKRSIALDLKLPDDRETVLALVEQADVLTEGFRPQVAERLGVGPADCHARKPALVYGRMTGWGQHGPRAQQAGHDLNYIGLVGALHTVGPSAGPPALPINYVGDFGGGALYLVVGVLAALREAQRTGCGRVVDAAIVDGAAHLMASVHLLRNAGAWEDAREANLLDGAAPFYRCYATQDGGWMAVGAIEPKFYATLLATLALDLDPAAQHDRAQWPRAQAAIADRFASEPLSHWEATFAERDACVSPVRSLAGAETDPHLRERGTLRVHDGQVAAAPAPRFEPPGRDGLPPRAPRLDADRQAILEDWLTVAAR